MTKHIEGTKRPQPHPPHTRGTFHRRLQPLYTEKDKVSFSSFLPTTHGMQHSCSHSNIFQCDLQSQLQETHRTTHTGTTIVAKHIEGTKRPQPHPPHTRGTFHRRLQPLYTEKHKVSCFNMSPMLHSCNIPLLPLPFATTLHQGQFLSDVLLCNVKSHTTLHQGQFFSDVLLCNVKSHTTLHQGQSFCDVLLCNVKSHTTLHQGHFLSDVLLCNVNPHTAFHQGQFFSDVLLCNVESHTTLHQGQSFCDVLLCNLKSHTTLHQSQFFFDVLLCSLSVTPPFIKVKLQSRTTFHHFKSQNSICP